MNVSHAIQILITGKYLAGTALGEAESQVGGLGGKVSGLTKGLALLGKLGKGTFSAGIALPVLGAKLAVATLVAGLTLLVSALTAVVIAAAGVTAGLLALGSAISAGILSATKYAMSLENMSAAMWGIAGEAAPAMLEALQEASAFMLDQKPLIKSYNQAYMLLGKTLADRLPEAYQYLTKVAAATGDDAAELMQRLTRSVGRLSTRWMSYIGTVVTVEEATAHAVTMFNKEADALSRTEIQAAMFDRVMMRLEARTAALPDVVGTANQMFLQFKTTMKDTWADVGAIFLPAARAFFKVVLQLAGAFARAVHEGGALYLPLRKLAAVFTVLFETLGGVVEQFLGIESTVSGRFEAFVDKIIDLSWQAVVWGANIVTNLAIGIIKGASGALTAAMNFVGQLLTYWLSPGSAPRVAPDLMDWGASAFTEFLKGFGNAQFDVLESVQRPLKQALSILVDLGQMGEIEGFEAFLSLSEGMAEAISEFMTTGKMSGDLLERLSQVSGGYGEELAKLFRMQLDVAAATKIAALAEERLNRARENEDKANIKLSKSAREYNKMVRAGADPALLKAKLAEVEASYDSLVAAREETEQAEEAKKAAEEALKLKKEQARAQERLLRQLIEMGRVLADLARARERGADDDDYIIPEIVWPEFHPPPLDEAFEELKEKIRRKFEELWTALQKQWEESGVAKSVDNVIAAWERLKVALSTVWEKIVLVWFTFKKFVLDPLWGWIVDEWDKWVAWWEEDGPIITKAIEKLWEDFELLLEDLFGWTGDWEFNWDTAYGIFLGFIAKIQILASGGMEILRKTITFWSQVINGDWEGAWGTAVEIGTIAWDTFHAVTGGKLLELSGLLFNFAADPSGTLRRVGTDIVTRIYLGLVAAWVVVPGWFLNALVNLGLVVIGAALLLWEVGKAIVTGIANAIYWNAYLVQTALSVIINAAIAAIKRALGIYSPSKVFADIGKDMITGLVQGIEALADEPELALNKVLDMSLDTPKVGVGLSVGVAGGVTPRGRTSSVLINNYFGRDSIRDDRDVMKVAEQIERGMRLRGIRNVVG